MDSDYPSTTLRFMLYWRPIGIRCYVIFNKSSSLTKNYRSTKSIRYEVLPDPVISTRSKHNPTATGPLNYRLAFKIVFYTIIKNPAVNDKNPPYRSPTRPSTVPTPENNPIVAGLSIRFSPDGPPVKSAANPRPAEKIQEIRFVLQKLPHRSMAGSRNEQKFGRTSRAFLPYMFQVGNRHRIVG